jgi:hypothetical protein
MHSFEYGEIIIISGEFIVGMIASRYFSKTDEILYERFAKALSDDI